MNVFEMKCLRIWLDCHDWIELGMKRERRKVNVFEMKCLRIWFDCHDWIELGMKRCAAELE